MDKNICAFVMRVSNRFERYTFFVALNILVAVRYYREKRTYILCAHVNTTLFQIAVFGSATKNIRESLFVEFWPMRESFSKYTEEILKLLSSHAHQFAQNSSIHTEFINSHRIFTPKATFRGRNCLFLFIWNRVHYY